jgi:hypothetical protein
MTNLAKYKGDLDRLIEQGQVLLNAMQAEYLPEQFDAALKEANLDVKKLRASLGSFSDEYQGWYSEARAVVKQLLPDRLDDFVRHYEKPKGRKNVGFENYRIEDALQGLIITRSYGRDVVAAPDAAIPHFRQQLKIVEAVKNRFETSLFDIRQLVQADLFDSELDVARELTKKGFLRAAGAVAGVVLEKHLLQVASNHSISGKKAHPSISDLNDALKSNGVYDVPEWRRVQRLGDIRNMCDHGKTREPTADEIEELIDGTDKFVKTIF